MTSIRLGAKPNVRESSKGKGKSKGRVQDDDFGPQSLFKREATDFDLVSQLTHMAAVSTAGISRDKLFEGTASLDYSTSKYFRRVHRVAQRLGTHEVIFPVSAGVASAAGLLVSPAASHHVRTFIRRLDRLDKAELERVFDAIEGEGKHSLQRLSLQNYALEQRLEMRYVGQGFEVEVKLTEPLAQCSIDDLRKKFEAEYVRLYGRVPGDLPIEIINCRVSLSGLPQKIEICPPLGDTNGNALKGERKAYFAESGGFATVCVYSRDRLAANQVIVGPAIIEEPECTIIVPPGQECRADRFGNLIMGIRRGA